MPNLNDNPKMLVPIERLRNLQYVVRNHPSNPKLICIHDSLGALVFTTQQGSSHLLKALGVCIAHDRALQAALRRLNPNNGGEA